ncbi:helix-turn-helix domain-containing protein [Streptomyces formicae]|uniref:Helix-turn-helix transcriptional regulator n=1 Tax=Streptomyces formicae TaxID=1616117 RepID=A0ABY3WY96_9ACTN|nr:helix-turn-helix transcriptional regulator [Streptomyces formicae]UNM15762.1 helix-turn-helix transcriptional regulator [Streptomyces formicae]
MGERDEAVTSTPIGARLAAWRMRRGLAREDLAARAGVSPAHVMQWETGRDWMDRRGPLAALAGALRLDPGELTGQPYPPAGDEHASVRAIAFHLRRQLAQPQSTPTSAGLVGDLASRMQAAAAAEAAGDEHTLARALPDLIRAADQVVPVLPSAGREQGEQLRVQAHVLAAGLLRRLGYRDLAWMMLHRARPGVAEPLPVLVEEVRLLIDLGLPEYALARAARAEGAGDDTDLRVLTAFAQAMAGRRRRAEELLSAAARRAVDEQSLATVAAARAAVAVEHGAPDEAAEHARAAESAALSPAARSRLLRVAAAAAARQGDTAQAITDLAEAEAAAPLRLRLDPFARELIAALPARASNQAQAEVLARLAERTGLR